MAKHGEGLGAEIVKAVNNGEIIEPITINKVKEYCQKVGLNPSKQHMSVILSNATENDHSPTYKKYFERVGRGEYVVSKEYRCEKISYYWLNLDSVKYEWCFSDMKIGCKQEYSSRNSDGGERKIQKCFHQIKIGDRVLAYETGTIKAITSICRVTDKYEYGDETIIEFTKERDFDNWYSLDEMNQNQTLSNCTVIHMHRGTLFEIEKLYFDIIEKSLEGINKQDYNAKFLGEINEAKSMSNEQRKQYLDARVNKLPERISTTSNTFRRDVVVVVEVLERATGYCERCKQPAPFIKATNGDPYLEVHHKIRLADGGEDTVENAIAVCPNCHRELHFGI